MPARCSATIRIATLQLLLLCTLAQPGSSQTDNPVRERADTAEATPTPSELADQPATASRTAIEKAHAPVLRRESDAIVNLDEESKAAVKATVAAKPTPPAASGDSTDETSELPSIAKLEVQLETIEKSESMDDEQKDTLRSLTNQTIEWLKATVELEQKTKAKSAELEAIPQQLERLRLALRNAAEDSVLPTLDKESAAALEPIVQQLADDLANAREQLAAHQTQAKDLQATRKNSQERQKEISEQRDSIEEALAAETPSGLSPLHARLLRVEQLAHLQMLKAQQHRVKAESKFARATNDVYPLQHDLDRRTIAKLEKLHEHYDDALTEQRHEESEQRIAEAKRKAREADPALRKLALRNAELAETRSKYHDRMQIAGDELTAIKEQFAIQEESFNSIQSKVEEIGMTEAISVLLRSQERRLIDDRPTRLRAKQIENDLPQIELELMRTRDEREAMWDMDQLTATYVSSLASRFSDAEATSMVRELLETRRRYLGELLTDLDSYQETLADLHFALKNTAEVTSDHHRYIDEHVLWIRSADAVSTADVRHSKMGVAELFGLEKWHRVVTDTGHAIQSRMMLSLISFAGLTICLVLGDRLKDRITEIGESKSVKSAYRFYPTAEAALATVILAFFLPAIGYFVSWCILASGSTSELTFAIGIGLKWTSMMWLGLSLLQQVVRTGGLAECHFGWHGNNLRVVRHNLHLLLAFGLPAVFIVMVIGTFQQGKWVSSLGRLSFMGGMAIMALFMHRLLDPYRASSGVWANRNVWPYKVRHLLHAACVAAPLALTIFAAMGYVYSAHQLAYRAQLSLWLVLVVVLSHAMIARYLLIARRNAAVRHSQRRRTETDDTEIDVPTEEALDFQAIGNQLQRLLRATAAVTCVLGASFIWADMVPALMAFDRVEIWTTTQMVSEKVQREDGSVQVRTIPRIDHITLADGLLGLLSLVATVVAARNIPGLLNVTIFERLPIDYGTRYALTAVSRYVISLVGIVTAFYLVGITWNSVQWLVAAMTVGLGFGLQEIFANFVSGLIILTERPVRVGDMVTVGGVTGKVTRVQIRATTITDFDRRELVVPNKRFITEDVINWTLSDPISRVILPVGIAYACDPKLAREKLLDVAMQHPLVLSEPDPTAIFMGFGDSTLDLELRVFIVGRDNAFQVRDELNLAINSAFKAAALEIAYPQRDLHIRSVDGQALADTLVPAAKRAA